MPDEILMRPELATNDRNWPVIVHCHLRWDFVWQRPQQLFSRFARRHRILFLEEPVFDANAEPGLLITEPQANIVRVVPVLTPDMKAVEAYGPVVLALVKQAIAEHPLLEGQFDAPVGWFYSPMTARYLQGQFGEIATVYDCMDELANFRFAPGDIAERERFLMSKADVVFTGGFELMQVKARLHHNVHFHGCGVDAAHYGKARESVTPVPDEVAGLPRPILGYFGVIDERLDYDLIARLARHFMEGSVVMVGPVAKVDPESLPRLPNLRWLGQRPYEDLPMLVKSFDVCLMPFAMNDATRFINPTKTLEYMAAGKPIVCTAVPEVVRRFHSIVAVGRTADEFIAHVEQACRKPDAGILESGVGMAANASWDAIVNQMRATIAACVGDSVGQTALQSR